MRSFRPYFSLGKCFLALAGSAILAFGLYNVHSFSNVTEGGVLGMTLLLHHWFGLSPSISGLVLNAACFSASRRHPRAKPRRSNPPINKRAEPVIRIYPSFQIRSSTASQ